MRRILAQFLLLRFLGMFVFVLFALTSLLVLFDLLAHADDLAVNHQNTFLPMAWYAGLRLPVLLVMITPISVLLAALVTFERLATQFEFTALQSAGVSLYQVSAVLFAGGLAICALQAAVTARFATPAEARLFRWAERNYAGLPDASVLEPGAAWFTSGGYRIHIANASDAGHRLERVLILHAQPPGTITSYLEARSATSGPDGWTLVDGWEQVIAGGPLRPFAQRTLPLAFRPDHVVQVRLPVSALDLGTLQARSREPAAVHPLPTHHYRTWLYRRFAEPLGSLVMILLAAPMGLQLRRSGRQLLWGSLALGFGFLFFICERILLAIGESGAIAPALAAWSPLACFGLAGVATLVTKQQ